VTTEAYEGNTPQGGASEGNAADDALMVIRLFGDLFPSSWLCILRQLFWGSCRSILSA